MLPLTIGCRPMAQFDVVVVGLGAMGSAALYRLARRGVRACRHRALAPGHDRGSSHGESRIIRLGYFEHPSYVPLLRRAYELWRELEAAPARSSCTSPASSRSARPDGEVVSGTLAASRLHGLPHEVMDAAETHAAVSGVPNSRRLRRRVPAGRRLHRGRSRDRGDARAGAGRGRGNPDRRHACCPSTPHGDGVRIATDRGDIEARTAIVAAGAWVKTAAARFAGAAARHPRGDGAGSSRAIRRRSRPAVSRCSCSKAAHGIHYGFPPFAGGAVKIAKHHHSDETVDPETLRPCRLRRPTRR